MFNPSKRRKMCIWSDVTEIHYVNSWLKRCVFNLDLNRDSVSEPWTLSGRLFQSLGDKCEKALPLLVDFAILELPSFGLFPLVNGAWSVNMPLLLEKRPLFQWRKQYYGLWARILAQKQRFEIKKVLMMDLFHTNTQLFTSLMDWSGLLWSFY